MDWLTEHNHQLMEWREGARTIIDILSHVPELTEIEFDLEKKVPIGPLVNVIMKWEESRACAMTRKLQENARKELDAALSETSQPYKTVDVRPPQQLHGPP